TRQPGHLSHPSRRSGRTGRFRAAQTERPYRNYLCPVGLPDRERQGRRPDRVLNTKGMFLNPNNPITDPPEYSPVAASSMHLAFSRTAPDIAEFEWRLSTPLSTLLLGMLAVPLSRVQPRQGRY